MDSQSLQDESTLDPASPQDTVDDDNRSSSSSQDLLQSMDEISSGSLSPDTTDRASPLESGIGTASPPRSTDRRIAKRKSIIAPNDITSFSEIATNLPSSVLHRRLREKIETRTGLLELHLVLYFVNESKRKKIQPKFKARRIFLLSVTFVFTIVYLKYC